MSFSSNCQYCSTVLKKTFIFCPSCGSKISKEINYTFFTFIFILISFSIVLLILYFQPKLDDVTQLQEKLLESFSANSTEDENKIIHIITSTIEPTSLPVSNPISSNIIQDNKVKDNTNSTAEIIDEIWDKNELYKLKLFALELINKERIKHGVDRIELGQNDAAQIHAEDARKYEHWSNWTMSGEKPYQIYSRTGGNSIISENSSFIGWTKEDREKENCSTLFIICEKINPKEGIKELTLDMIYDDLICCDNGHRDNLLDPSHLKVNIGIAVDPKNWFLTYYQHFEGGHFVAEEFPLFIKDENIKNIKYQNTLKFKIKNLTKEYKFIDSSIRVFFDPMPKSVKNSSGKHPNKFEYYCVGGGYSVAGCDDDRDLFVDIIKPGYIADSNKDIHAFLWWETDDFLEVEVEFWDIEIKPGIYTIIIFGENLRTGISDQLIELSVIKE